MIDFQAWRLLNEVARPFVPQGVLAGYEQALKKELLRLIQRTKDPYLRDKFTEMLDCPIKDARGTCRSFSDYTMSALVKNGIHQRYDLEAALAYVFEKMLMDKTDTGEARRTVFGDFTEKPGLVEGNPLQARFMLFLNYAIRNVRQGKVPRLANTRRLPGTVSIGQGRRREGDPADGISPEEIVAHSSAEGGLDELVSDISDLLRRKEPETGLPLVKMFVGMVQGEKTAEQRRTYGERAARKGREIILQTIEDYARSSGNHFLLRQVEMLKGHNPREPLPPRRSAPKATKPQRERGKEKDFDFSSIVSVVERLGRPAGSSDLMKYRRRWVEYPPRTQEAGYKNRLEEVLDLAVKEGVLKAMKSAKGADIYDLGPNAEKYRHAVGAGGFGG